MINGQWGTICDDFWDENDGSVICHQLGFTGLLVVRPEAFFGEGVGPIWFDDVSCNGSEIKLDDCQKSLVGMHNCAHGEDAGVECIMSEAEGKCSN